MTKKKIVFCIHKMSPFYKVVKEALIKIGFEVYLFDYYQSDLKIRLMGFLNNIYEFDDNRQVINEKINISLLNKVNKIQPDYLLIIKGLHISNETISNIKTKGVITINWFQDLLEFMPWLKKHANTYDFLFTPDPLMVRELKKNKIYSHYLPLAGQPDSKLNKTSKKYDIVFSGQYTQRRAKLFEELIKLGPKFVIWGYSGWKNSPYKNHYQGLLPSVSAMLQKYRESKIVINVQTAEDCYPSEVVSLRAFETTGVGTLLLNWYEKSINDFWEDGKEIVNFKTAQDAFNKARYYLEHDEERKKIAEAGWRRTKKDHTWEQRFKKIFEIVS